MAVSYGLPNRSPSRPGEPIVADTAGLSRLSKDLRAAAPEAWKAYRIAARALAVPVLRDAQARASYSSRIPGSGRIRITAGGNVKIVFGGPQAPDAAPIENKGKGFVRHPVYGNRNVWTNLNSHPAYATPAFEAHKAQVLIGLEKAVTDAVDTALRG